MQFVVLWSSKGKASDPQRSRKAKGAGMVIKIQCGEEDGGAQNGSVELQRVLLLAVCTIEGSIYCWFIPLWVAFALTGCQLPDLLGKVQGAVGGKGGAHLCSRNAERLSAALVQQRVWSTRVIRSLAWPAAPVSAAALTPSALSSSFKNKSTLKSGNKKKRSKKALQCILKDKQKQHSHQWHSSCCWCPIACSWLCQHLWMCLLPLALHVWCSRRATHSIHTFLAGMLQSHKLPCASCVFRDRYSKWAECSCCLSPLGYTSHIAASTPACQDLLLLHFLNPPFCSRLVKHRLIPCSTGYFLFSNPVPS